MANIAQKIYSLIEETVLQQNVTLWDVKFLKEGASWYLRIFIDKDEGISIDDCTNVSHAIDEIIDEADPIDRPYYLEVCSPGLERELSRDFHFVKMRGKKIKVRLYKALDGKKEFVGILKQSGKEIVLETQDGIRTFTLDEISKANLCDFE